MSHDVRGWQQCITPALEESPLYQYMANALDQDSALRALRDLLDPDQPNLILLLTVINYLVFTYPQEALAAFYGYLSPHPRPAHEVGPVLRSFCLRHEQELRALLPTARLQTNEVGRWGPLLLAFYQVFLLGGSKPLTLFELGCSAGLGLNWDRYHYTYNQSMSSGDTASPVHLHSTVQGDLPPIPKQMPPIAQKVGIELAPLDLTNEEHVRWLRASIWAGLLERYPRFDAAVALARQYPPEVLAGDACIWLPRLLETVSPSTTLCIYNSFALNQGPEHVRTEVRRLMEEFSYKQTVYHLSLEVQPPHRSLPWLELSLYEQGELVGTHHLATSSLHGDRIEWHATLASENQIP
jgi:hypothetical protein